MSQFVCNIPVNLPLPTSRLAVAVRICCITEHFCFNQHVGKELRPSQQSWSHAWQKKTLIPWNRKGMEMTASLHHLWLVTSHLGLRDVQVTWSPASLFFRGAGSMSQTPSLLQSSLLQVYTQSYFNESKRSTQAAHLLTAPRSASPFKTQMLRGLLSPFSCDQADNWFSPNHCVDQTNMLYVFAAATEEYSMQKGVLTAQRQEGIPKVSH